MLKFFLVSDSIPESFNLFLKNWRIGFEKTEGDNVPASYYIYEVFILLFVVIHMISLIFHREIDIESIDEAAERVGKQSKSKL